MIITVPSVPNVKKMHNAKKNVIQVAREISVALKEHARHAKMAIMEQSVRSPAILDAKSRSATKMARVHHVK